MSAGRAGEPGRLSPVRGPGLPGAGLPGRGSWELGGRPSAGGELPGREPGGDELLRLVVDGLADRLLRGVGLPVRPDLRQ